MPDQLKTLLIITSVVFALFALWAISIGITYWDIVSHRKLSGGVTAAWVALVVLIPGIGFVAYLFARLLEKLLSQDAPAGGDLRRLTMLKRQSEPEWRTGTISAAELLEPALSEDRSTQKTRGLPEKGIGKYKLTIIAGPHVGLEYILDNLPVKIGRGREVSIPLNEDQGVSRQHAEIYEQTGNLRIRDLKSTHGTKVNDFGITDKGLESGDQIQVGESILLVGVREENR